MQYDEETYGLTAMVSSAYMYNYKHELWMYNIQNLQKCNAPVTWSTLPSPAARIWL